MLGNRCRTVPYADGVILSSHIMRAMRRWMLLAMILLLPLRGWIVDAMAAEMLQQRAVEVHAAAAAPHSHATALHHQAPAQGCDEHARAVANDDDASAATPAAGDYPTCASCQVCSSVALSPAVLLPLVHLFSQQRPVTAQAAYASAEPELAFKPPRH